MITQVVTVGVAQLLQVHLFVYSSLIRQEDSDLLHFVMVSFQDQRLCLVVSSFGSLIQEMIDLTITAVTIIVDHELPCPGWPGPMPFRIRPYSDR